MRVLHAISGLRATAGGTVTALLGLARAQRDAGCAVTLVSTFVRPETQEIAALQDEGFDLHTIGPCRDPMSRSRQIRPKLQQLVRDVDVVHIHGLWEQIHHEAAVAARRASIPYIFSPHGMLDPWSLNQGGLKKKLYLLLRLKRDLQRAAAIHYTTSIEEQLARPLGLQPPPIVEPIGIDFREFEHLPPRGAFRAKYGITHAALVVLFLARLHRKKGLDLLIPAASEALPRTAVLVLAGPDEGGYRADVESMIEQHGLSERVVFTGMLDSRQRLEALADADLFILPSYQENFGIAVVEALAAGVPVIVSDQVNLHAEIAAERVGAVVPTQAAALARELRRWLNDESLRADVAARAPCFVRERFDWKRIAARWVSHYAALRAPR